MRIWAKREAQICGVIESRARIYGDLQVIAGTALDEIDGFALPLLEIEAGQGPGLMKFQTFLNKCSERLIRVCLVSGKPGTMALTNQDIVYRHSHRPRHRC